MPDQTDYQDPAFKAWFLNDKGLDPAKYDIDSTGKVFEKAEGTPTNQLFPDMFASSGANAAPAPPTDQYSATQSMLGHTAASVLPTIGSAAGGAGLMGLGAMAAESWLGGPVTGVPGTILAGALGLAGATGGGYLTSKAQGALLPDSANEALAEQSKEHPYASGLGELIPGLVTANPAKSLKNIATSGSKAFGQGLKSLTDDEVQNLTRAAVNVGGVGGIDVASQLQSGQPFNYGRLGMSLLGAGAMNENNELLGKYNPLDIFSRGKPEDANLPPEPGQGGPTTSTEQLRLPSSGYQMPESSDELAPQKLIGSGPPAPKLLPASSENGPYIMPSGQYNMPDSSLSVDRPNMGYVAPTPPYYSGEPADHPTVYTAPKEVRQPVKRPSQASGQPIDVESEEVPQPTIQQPSGYVQKTVDSPIANAKNPLETSAQKAMSGQTKYQTPEGESDSSDLFSNVSPEYRQAMQDLADKRGISLSEADRILKGDHTPVMGAYDPADRSATVSRELGESDTPQHEVAHGYLQDLLNSTDPNDIALAQKALNIFKGNENDAEEALVSRLGKQGAARSGLEGGDKFTNWMKEFVSRWKNNLGIANDEDTLRLLTQRLHTDAPYGSRSDLIENVARDKGRYDGLVSSLKAEPDWNKKMDIQREIEALKNQYGGRPPKYQTPSADFHPLGERPEQTAKPKPNDLGHDTFRLTRSLADEAMLKEGPRSYPAIQGAVHQVNLKDEYFNRYENPINKATSKLSKDQKDYLERLMLAEKKDQMSYEGLLTNHPKLQEAYTGVRNTLRTMQEDRINANQPVNAQDGTPRVAKIDPYYYPERMDPAVIDMLRAGGPQAEALKNDWQVHAQIHGIAPGQAMDNLNKIVEGYTSKDPNFSHFRGLDLEQGIGLPRSFMRPGFDRNMNGYIRRYANARAYHDAIESNPNIAPLYGIKKSPWGAEYSSSIKPLMSKEFQHIAEHIKGQDYNPEEGAEKAFSRAGAATILGPMTNIHIFGSTVANAFGYAKPSEVAGMVASGFTHFGDSIQHAMDTGLYQNKSRIFRDLFDAHASMVEKVNSLADGIGRLGGRNVTDYMTKGITQGMGEYLVRRRLPEAASGDPTAQRFLRNLDPSYSPSREYGEQDVWRLASNFVRQLHGTHDFRTLPGWMLKDNVIQPFLSLMSWNVTQTNSFWRNVVSSARRDGNYTPLIMSTLGAGLGGYIIKEAREKIANKQAPFPSLEEIVKSSGGVGNAISQHSPLIAYNLAAMASYAGYAGLLSTGTKALFDGAYKNPMQGAVFPLDEVVGNTARTMSNAYAAMANSGPDEYMRIGSRAVADLFKNNVQLARLGLSWADEEGLTGEARQKQKVLNNEENDLRKFKIMQGLPTTDESTIDESNPYYNMGRKAFLKENDIGQAASMLPAQIASAYAKSNGNMELFKQQMRALKASKYPSMPSPDQTPMQFWRYVQYLKDTQGDDAANARMQEYFYNNAIDKAKNAMVPSY